jgi:hypothetical protein
MILPYDALIQELLDTLRGYVALRYWLDMFFFYQYSMAELHALIADVDFVATDQLADF